MTGLRIAIISGSTRPGRVSEQVAQWVLGIAQTRTDATFELLDIADQHLPLFDEPIPPSMGKYQHAHTRAWAEKVASYDGFVFVTPEYNHGVPGALKNAIDFVYAEWNNKAAGFVSYGSAGGVRAVEQLRQVMAEVQVADVRMNPFFSLSDDFEQYRTFKPRAGSEDRVRMMLDQVVSWSKALRTVRHPA